MVLALPPKSTVPERVGTVATLLGELTEMGVASVSVRTPPVATLGLVVLLTPPLLLKTRLVSVLAPASVTVDKPFRVNFCGAITAPAVSLKVPSFRVTPLPPAGRLPVAATVRALLLMMVPPL